MIRVAEESSAVALKARAAGIESGAQAPRRIEAFAAAQQANSLEPKAGICCSAADGSVQEIPVQEQ
jgi:hypothetical protein